MWSRVAAALPRLVRALIASALVLGSGFGVGMAYAQRHQPRQQTQTPSPQLIAHFAALDVCDGERPTASKLDPVISFAAGARNYVYLYRCPDGTSGRAWGDTPLVAEPDPP